MSDAPRTCCRCGGDEALAMECRCAHGQEWKVCEHLAAVKQERDKANERAEYAEGCNKDLAAEIERRHGIGGELIAAWAERDQARQEADLLRRQVYSLVSVCVNHLDCEYCPVDSSICFGNHEICKQELTEWAAQQAKEGGK